MVKMTLAAALEKIHQGCTELNLDGACSGAPPHPRGTAARAHACRGVRAARRPERIAARARRAHRACAPRAAANDIKDQAALDAIQSILDANEARPVASVRRAFTPRRDPAPRSAALLGASALYAPSPRECLPLFSLP